MKVGLIIVTMNNPNRIDKLLKNVSTFFDEILIVDSSNKKNFKILMKILKKYQNVKIINVPPLGFVDPYLQLALELIESQYVLLLADDEFPSEYLLKDIRKLTTRNKVYKILRYTPKFNRKDYPIRLFPKNLVIVHGLIHFGEFASKIKPITLDEDKYYIVHNQMEDINLNKLRKYAIIDAYQAAMKILWITNTHKKYYRYVENKFGYHLLKLLHTLSGVVNAFILVAAIAYYSYFLIEHIIKQRKVGIIYYLLVISEIIKDYKFIYKIYRQTKNLNICRFTISVNDLPLLSRLRYDKTYENFIILLKKKLNLA